ncbi:sensor histidine kinase [Rhodohalobacter sp.]|uniref:sensor histidine kinase n=1 Tax=Rhodohalobacter sp. TaxID=1974210 RepID=UPI002ACD6FDC|nr:ATP-binding protein [Rhodohalobacter sp.]MDZ7755430.1 ATP-binding protein [Rhodohalobacter sp.]
MIKNLWHTYRETVIRHCTVPEAESTALEYWRNDLFAASVLYLIPLGLIPLFLGIYVAYSTELYLLMAVDLIAVMCLFSIAFSRGISIFYRKLIFCSALYMVSLALLYSLGSYGPGLLYLLGVTLFAVLIFDEVMALMSVYINIIVCVLIGIMIYYELGGGVITQEYDLASWFAVSSNLVLLCAVAVLLIPRLFKGLESAFEKRSKLEAELLRNQKSLEESLVQLEEKNKELEEFAYIASHDLKEPLRMIQGFMNLLKSKYEADLDSRAQKYIYFAVDGAERMSKLIDDLLEYSRIGRVHTKLEVIDLNEILNKLVENEIHRAKDSEINIQFEKLPQIEAVPIAIEMLFKNLISNALKYQDGDHKPVIKIAAEEEESYWRFSISDNGIGIEKEYFDSIFMLFKRLHANNEYQGTGMGLAICKKIVEKHGGEIWVESEPGVGSTFYFTIKK